MSIHNGHRQRMRDRFLRSGLDGFGEHEVLEMMLYYSIPRRDTNEIAHKLLHEFGSLAKVLEAPVDILKRVDGVGENTAIFIHFCAAVSKYYRANSSKNQKSVSSIDDCIRILDPCFDGLRNETIFLLCLDAKGQVLCCRMVGEGSINATSVPLRKIVETALSVNSTSVVLAHNHPSGLAFPSPEDAYATKEIADSLRTVDIYLLDHLVFSDGECISMERAGMFKPGVIFRELRLGDGNDIDFMSR